MITKIRINEITVKRPEDAKNAGFDVLFNVEGIKVNGAEVIINYAYAASYKGNGGIIQIKGIITANEDEKTIKAIETEMKNNKLPPEYMQNVINTINYFGTSNATVIASIVGMPAPIRMPKLALGQKETDATKAKKK